MRLREAWIFNGAHDSAPPIPLVLDGWHFSSDVDKQQRWQMTLDWAREHSYLHLIPQFTSEEQYFTEQLTTSYPEQHYRPDRYAVREKPSQEAIEKALSILIRDWSSIVGSDLASVLQPHSITGSKARRLLITVTEDYTPPWGTWHTLSDGPDRESFSTFRRHINDAVMPVYFDHIDFDIRRDKAQQDAAANP